MLIQEREFYQQHLQQWLAQYAGRFVVVTGAELLGTYDTIEDALAAGTRRCGLSPFLVRRVEPVAEEVQIPALALGILNAGPS